MLRILKTRPKFPRSTFLFSEIMNKESKKTKKKTTSFPCLGSDLRLNVLLFESEWKNDCMWFGFVFECVVWFGFVLFVCYFWNPNEKWAGRFGFGESQWWKSILLMSVLHLFFIFFLIFVVFDSEIWNWKKELGFLEKLLLPIIALTHEQCFK